MSLLRRLLTSLGGGGGVWFIIEEVANIFSTVNLCVLPVEKLVVQPTSIATLSISEVRLVVSPSSEFDLLTRLSTSRLVVSPTTEVELSVALT